MWNLYHLALTWSQRPSSFVDGLNDYEAYCFDQAVTYCGKYIQAELDQVKLGKGKNAEKMRAQQQQTLLDKLLYGNTRKQQFRDPAMR